MMNGRTHDSIILLQPMLMKEHQQLCVNPEERRKIQLLLLPLLHFLIVVIQ